jgi:hypothetical protein
MVICAGPESVRSSEHRLSDVCNRSARTFGAEFPTVAAQYVQAAVVGRLPSEGLSAGTDASLFRSASSRSGCGVTDQSDADPDDSPGPQVRRCPRWQRPGGRSRTSNRFSHIHGLPGLIARSKPLISRTLARMALCKSTLSRVQTPCLKLPFRFPRGPPEPFAPPCIRHRARPVTAACLQG